MLKNIKKYISNNWLFICILIIQLLAIIFTFAFFKQGYHSDELYEYGFANSYNLRVLEMDNNGVGLDRQWTDSKELLKYISVEKDHRFSYKNIYMHATMDYYNPPFKLFVLHTICSFFPGKFSKWYSFVINIASFILIQFALYHLLYKMLNNKFASIAGVVLFGFGAGCLDSMVFLRMYSLGMAFGVLFLYFSYCLFEEKVKNKILLYILTFISLFLGAFTLHLFLVFAFPIVVVFCFGFLFSKRIKKMLAYGFTCLFSVIFSFIAFPQTFGDTTPSNESLTYALSSYSQPLQFRIYSHIITIDNIGFHTSVYANPWIKNSLAILIFLVIVFTPLFILIRKEEWFKKFLNSAFNKLKTILKSMNYSYIILISCLCSIVFMVYICSIRTSVHLMSFKFASRYVFMIYPLVSIFVVSVLYYFLAFIMPRIKVVSIYVLLIAFLLAMYSQFLSQQNYLLQHEEKGITLKDIETNANCLATLYLNWMVICLAPEINHTNSYYFVDYNHYKTDDNCFENIDKSAPMYLIMDRSVVLTKEQMKIMEEDKNSVYNIFYNNSAILDEDIINYYSSFDEVKRIELVGYDEVFCRPLEIYRITFN